MTRSSNGHDGEPGDPLNQPLKLRSGSILPNRLAKAAMSEQLADVDGRAGQSLRTLYERWSHSGAGLLITGNVMVDRKAISEPAQVVVEDRSCTDWLRQWSAAAHSHGEAQVWMQINHGGRQIPRMLICRPRAPSPVKVHSRLFGRPRELSADEIENLVSRFATTAGIAVRSGFDGVQIHAAHGYLISQFLSPSVNQRSDRWGGSPDNRRRFLELVVEAVRREIGDASALSVKLNSTGSERDRDAQEENIRTICWLAENGVDLVEISGGSFESPDMLGPRRHGVDGRDAYFLAFAELVREATDVPLMVTGGFRERGAIDAALGSGVVDVIGMARPFVIDTGIGSGLLDGSRVRVPTKNLALPRAIEGSMIGGALDIGWHTEQIRNLALQEPIRVSESAARAGARYLRRQVLDSAALRLRRCRHGSAPLDR